MGDFRDPAVAESWHAKQLAHPARGRQLDLLVDLLVRTAPRRIVDLGVGSGLVAERLLEEIPTVSLIGVDFSPIMLRQAGDRLARFEDRVTLVEADLSDPDRITLPPGKPFDAAITVQALHNIRHAGQQQALAWAGRILAPGAVLLSLDKVALPRVLYEFHASLGDLPSRFEDYEARERAAAERSPALEPFLGWLRAAGFEPSVLDLHANYALVAARTAG